MKSSDLLQLSASEIAEKIRRGEVSPLEAVDAHIERIEQVNPRINAVITPCFDQARREAGEKARHIEKNGNEGLPPLFGVPVTIKDCWPVKDVRFTAGSWYLRDNVAGEDAEAVAILRGSGAVIIGKTNLPDMCWLGESSNPVFGQTSNPHDLRCTAGGSSGGEGAIIAAGGSPLGLGSDIAGSVRIPAAANGCVCLKPSAGRIPVEGHLPEPPCEIFPWNTAGPMARRVEDLALALSVLSRTPVQDYRQIDLKDRPCKVYIENGLLPVHPGVAETVLTAMETLRRAGMTTDRDDTLPMPEAAYLYTGIFRTHGGPEIRAALGGGRPYSLPGETVRTMLGKGRISARVLFFTFAMDRAGADAVKMGLNTFEKLAELRGTFLDRMGAGGVLLTPVFITPPPRHGWTWRLMKNPPYTLMFNALGFPAAVVPVRYEPDTGLPLAVQVVARPGEDEVAIAAVAELERVHGGWKMAHAM